MKKKRLGALTLMILCGLPAALRGEEARPVLQGGITTETGVEYDSNASREEGAGQPGSGSPLVRALARGQLGLLHGRHRLQLQLALGGKLFFLPPAMGQNAGVVQLHYSEGAQLGAARLLGIADYYDAYQQANDASARDFRAANAGLRVHGAVPAGRTHQIDLSLEASGQLFMYKPDPTYTFVGPSMSPRLLVRLHEGDPELGHDIELSFSGRVDYRRYPSDPRDPLRRDIFLQTGASLTWIGPVLLQGGYAIQLNLSSLDIEAYQRHLVMVKLAARVPGSFFVTLKAQLNPVQTAPYIPVANIDEENRSMVMADVERPLVKGFAISARYTAYFNIAGKTEYQRHTACLGFSYRLAR